MNKRKFLQMLGCLPFMGIAAKSLNGMELVTDKDVLVRLGWIETGHPEWRWSRTYKCRTKVYIGKKIKPTAKVGKSLSETDLQNLYMRNAA